METARRRPPPVLLDPSFINTLALRFRPIAPKPPTGEPPRVPALDGARPKRKYAARRRNERRGRNPSAKQQLDIARSSAEEPSRTRKEAAWGGDKGNVPRSPLLPDLNDEVGFGSPPSDRHERVLETWLVVESVVKDAGHTTPGVVGFLHQQGRKITDEERVRGLKRDACPGFVTDAGNLIGWVNGACERMVREQLTAAGGGVAALWVVTKEDLPYSCREFTCRMRILHAWRDEGWGSGGGTTTTTTTTTVVAPCDAWRLDSGGFAWRLDVDAALTLGFP